MINDKAFKGAAIRDKNLKQTGTVGEKKEPKKGDTRNNGSERYTGSKWVSVDKVKEAKKKAASEAKKNKESRHAYVGNR
tara:strand:+ start:407 stop:643 length:237 start_codon:yes stop_codon:yes gene_type:complete